MFPDCVPLWKSVLVLSDRLLKRSAVINSQFVQIKGNEFLLNQFRSIALSEERKDREDQSTRNEMMLTIYEFCGKMSASSIKQPLSMIFKDCIKRRNLEECQNLMSLIERTFDWGLSNDEMILDHLACVSEYFKRFGAQGFSHIRGSRLMEVIFNMLKHPGTNPVFCIKSMDLLTKLYADNEELELEFLEHLPSFSYPASEVRLRLLKMLESFRPKTLQRLQFLLDSKVYPNLLSCFEDKNQEVQMQAIYTLRAHVLLCKDDEVRDGLLEELLFCCCFPYFEARGDYPWRCETEGLICALFQYGGRQIKAGNTFCNEPIAEFVQAGGSLQELEIEDFEVPVSFSLEQMLLISKILLLRKAWNIFCRKSDSNLKAAGNDALTSLFVIDEHLAKVRVKKTNGTARLPNILSSK
jgi:hypothetical protein